MDINSPQAQYLSHQFTRGRMQATYNRRQNPVIINGFVNLDENQVFVWTNKDRIIRTDAPSNQLNAIAANRQYFEHIVGLAPGEVVVQDKVMVREDILPLPTMLSRIRDRVLPTVGLWIGFSIFTSVAGFAIGAAAPTIMYGMRRIFHRHATPAQLEAGHQAAMLNDAQNGEPHAYPRPPMRQAVYLSRSDAANDLPPFEDMFDIRVHQDGHDVTAAFNEMSRAEQAIVISSGAMAGVLTYKLVRDLTASSDERLGRNSQAQ